MGNLTRQKINDYYEQFRPVDVTFTKEVIQTTGLVTKEIQLKCASDFFPCVIYSTSFEASKVVANNKSGLLDKLRTTNNVVSIRFFFKLPATDEQIAFLIPSRMTGISQYGPSPDMSCFTLEYSSRPPDDLIEIMGRILEANMNFTKRKCERVLITPETMRKIGLLSKDVSLAVNGAARHCILREMFFGGARIITMGEIPFSGDTDAVVKMDFEDPREECLIQGKLVKSDPVVANNNMFILTLLFTDPVPMPYKVRINDYISSIKPEPRKEPSAAVGAAAPASAEAASTDKASSSAAAAAGEAAAKDAAGAP